MSDDAKTWQLADEDALAIESGAELMEKLEELEVGPGLLAVGMAKFQFDEDGRMVADVPAAKVAKAYFKSRYAGFLTEAEVRAGVVGDDYQVLDHHKDMVKQLCETGTYSPQASRPVTLADKFRGVKKIGKRAAAGTGRAGRPKGDEAGDAAK